ncbi:MAG: TSUP family transporter [Rhizobiaceae bacterium]|nr:TSUP family transporter [Rhizobiaceae bacterium]
MIEFTTVAIIFCTFLMAGTVKGVIGLGLPTVSLAILAVTFDLTTAMALLIAPSLVTNIWQAAIGGHAKILLKRLWPFLLFATVTIWIGALGLKRVDLALLSALLGLLLIAYALVGLTGFRISIDRHRESWVAPIVGALNGILTGLTGSFVVPGVMYLQAIGLPRDQLVQAMGMLFTVSTLALGLALGGNGLLSWQLALTSLAALVPAIIGMMIGQRLRMILSEQQFRRVFFVALLALGIYIVVQSGALATG